jgi:hypothetical protein
MIGPRRHDGGDESERWTPKNVSLFSAGNNHAVVETVRIVPRCIAAFEVHFFAMGCRYVFEHRKRNESVRLMLLPSIAITSALYEAQISPSPVSRSVVWS